MADRITILGSGAACGVPTISGGWKNCNPQNPKNRRSRAGIYAELGTTEVLIDTSADLRNQMLDNNIHSVDGVLYTHAHADHIMGIDDLRALNYYTHIGLNIYAAASHLDEIRLRFGYVFQDVPSKEKTRRPQLIANVIKYNEPFYIGKTEIMPLEFAGHTIPTTGYVFNRGQAVIIPDYKKILPETLEYLQKIDVHVLIMPLTNIETTLYHAGIDIDMNYIRLIKPEKAYFTHMGPDCDYDAVAKLCPSGVMPAYDGLKIEL